MPRVFLQETTHKPLKVASAKSLFSSVYVIGTTCFGECFSFYVITKRHYTFFEASVLKEVRYFMRFLDDNKMIRKFKNEAIMFLNFPNYFTFLTAPVFLHK